MRSFFRSLWSGAVLSIFVIVQLFLLVGSPQTAHAAEVDIAAETVLNRNVGSPTSVFISDQVGYFFYSQDNTNDDCGYRKTTDGGATWGSQVIIDITCQAFALWYDRWTPGDTGTKIYFLIENGTILYIIDTSGDTVSSAVNVGGQFSATSGDFSATAVTPTITKGTDGILYAGSMSATKSFVGKCSATCTTATNWTAAGTNPLGTVADDWIMLQPLASGNIILIRFDSAAGDMLSKVYTVGTTTWDAGWATIDASAPNNTLYDAAFGATVDRSNNNIYFAYAAQTDVVDTDDVRTATYNGSSWTAKTNCITDTGLVINAKIAVNENNNDIYCVYTRRTTAVTASTGNIYYKKSTDGMATWGSETQVNTTSSDIRLSNPEQSNSNRLHVAWGDVTNNHFRAATIVDLTPNVFTQTAYRFFANADSANVGSALAAQDTAATAPAQGTPFRLRMLVKVVGDGLPTSYENFKLQTAVRSGTCDTGFSGETYADVATGSGAIRFYNNTTPADAATLTANGSDPTDGGATIRNQTYEESNNFTNSVFAIATGEEGKWDFSLVDNSASAGAHYCFRAVKSDGTVFGAYTVIPEITIDSGITVSSTVYKDTNADGRVDRISITFGQTITTCTYDAADWSINTAGTINVSAVSGTSCTGSDGILNVAVTADANKTGGGTNPVISYANAGTADSVVASVGAVPSQSSLTATDGAAPVILTTTPASAGADLATTTSIVADFSETITIAPCTFSSSPDPGGFDSITNAGSWGAGTNGQSSAKVTLTHSTAYFNSTSVTITIGGCTDGTNTMAAGPVSNPWTFSIVSGVVSAHGGSGGTTSAQPSINVTLPFSGQQYVPGSNVSIEWQVFNGFFTHFSVYYSIDGGLNWFTVSSSVTGSNKGTTWLVPNTPTTIGVVRVTGYDAGTASFVTALSPGTFVIKQATLANPVSGTPNLDPGPGIPPLPTPTPTPLPTVTPIPSPIPAGVSPVPTPTPACTSKVKFYAYIGRGSNGASVLALQKILLCLGMFPVTVKPNGNFGPITVASVKKFQRSRKLLQVGYLGPLTRKSLNEYFR